MGSLRLKRQTSRVRSQPRKRRLLIRHQTRCRFFERLTTWQSGRRSGSNIPGNVSTCWDRELQKRRKVREKRDYILYTLLYMYATRKATAIGNTDNSSQHKTPQPKTRQEKKRWTTKDESTHDGTKNVSMAGRAEQSTHHNTTLY